MRFKWILYKFLILVLEQEDTRKTTHKILWSECFKAFAYFRIPIFRKEILAVMEQHEDDHVMEWNIRDFD